MTETQRFNGATAKRPWRTSLAPVYQRRRARASMGPRPSGRGERGNLAANVVEQHASFNGGAAARPGRRLAPAPLRRPASRFNGATAKGPWRTRRRTFRRQGAGYASMGPRPSGRGEALLSLILALGSTSFNGATAKRPWRRA